MRITTKLKLGFVIICFVIIPSFVVTTLTYVSHFSSGMMSIIDNGFTVPSAISKISFALNQINTKVTIPINRSASMADNRIYRQYREDILTNFQELRRSLQMRLTIEPITKTITLNLIDDLNEIAKIQTHTMSYLYAFERGQQSNDASVGIQDDLLRLHTSFLNTMKHENSSIVYSFFALRMLTAAFVYTAYFAIFLVAFFIARSIVNRLNILINAANAIKMKNYAIKIDDKYKDELTILSSTFNNMSASLYRYSEYITSLINVMPNIFIVTSNDFRIIKANQTALTEFGYSENEFLKLTLMDLVVDKSEDMAELDQAKKMLFRLRDDDEMPVIISSVTIHNIESNEIERIFIAQNISSLEKIERQIVKTARQAGMADLATSVIHNIGNILNSMRVSTTCLARLIAETKIQRLGSLLTMFGANKENQEGNIKSGVDSIAVGNYIVAMASEWESTNQQLVDEINSVTKNIKHINHIITVQQSLYESTMIVESTSLPNLIEEAITLNSALHTPDISLDKDFRAVQVAKLDRHKLLDVLVNLIKNSLEALSESHAINKKLTIELFEKTKTHFCIQVIDNGSGILEENIVRIFNHGVTTKEKGHGYGLHYSALSIAEMGGTLEAKSEGLNKGATFCIILPYSETDV